MTHNNPNTPENTRPEAPVEHKSIMGPFLLTLLFVCFLATGGIFVRLSELPPVTLGFYRVLFSLPLLYPFVKMSKAPKISRGDFWWLQLAGIFLTADLVLWNISFHHTTVANVNLLGNLVPFTIIPASYFLYKEKITPRFFLCLLITIVGLIVLVKGRPDATEGNLIGDFLALLTSVFYAAFMLVMYQLRGRATPLQIIYYSGFSATIGLLICSFIMEGTPALPTSWNAIYTILGLTLFSQILGQGGLGYVLSKISANIASLLMLTQPVIAAVYALVIFHETLSIQEMIGIAIILAGIFWVKKED